MVIYNEYIILRIIGEEGNYKISTATSDEDSGYPSAFIDQQTLMKAAEIGWKSRNWPVTSGYDMNHKEYITIDGTFDYLSDASEVIEIVVKSIEDINKSQQQINV